MAELSQDDAYAAAGIIFGHVAQNTAHYNSKDKRELRELALRVAAYAAGRPN